MTASSAASVRPGGKAKASRPRAQAISTSSGHGTIRQPTGMTTVSQFMPGEATGIGKGRTPT